MATHFMPLAWSCEAVDFFDYGCYFTLIYRICDMVMSILFCCKYVSVAMCHLLLFHICIHYYYL